MKGKMLKNSRDSNALVMVLFFAVVLLVFSAAGWYREHKRNVALRTELTSGPPISVDKLPEDASPAVTPDTSVEPNPAVAAALLTTTSGAASDVPWNASELRELGFENPAEDLRNDLLERKDLLPIEGTHGGTMAFRNVEFLDGGPWVQAYYEDGHYAGWSLLEYTVTAPGELKWKVLATNLP